MVDPAGGMVQSWDAQGPSASHLSLNTRLSEWLCVPGLIFHLRVIPTEGTGLSRRNHHHYPACLPPTVSQSGKLGFIIRQGVICVVYMTQALISNVLNSYCKKGFQSTKTALPLRYSFTTLTKPLETLTFPNTGSTGHRFSHKANLCLPPLPLDWQPMSPRLVDGWHLLLLRGNQLKSWAGMCR